MSVALTCYLPSYLLLCFQFCRQKFESLRDEKDHEIFNVREQSQKLQVQLNNGFSGFKDFKEKKAKEIQSLQAQIEDLSKVKYLWRPYQKFQSFSNKSIFVQLTE